MGENMTGNRCGIIWGTRGLGIIRDRRELNEYFVMVLDIPLIFNRSKYD